MTSAIKAIGIRRSCRTYDGSPLEPRDREWVLEALAGSSRGPFGAGVRLALVEPEGGPRSGSFGTYGFIRGAPAFIAGLVRRTDGAYEDYGYCLEKVVLEAAERGLGTCWLGGTFNRGDFVRGLEAGPGDAVPAVTPIGRPAAKGRLIDGFVRTMARSAARKPWESLFYAEDFTTPLSEHDAGPYARGLECVRLAPSAANRQPWRIVKAAGGKSFTFHINRPPMGSEAHFGMQDVDLGIAMCHFELAAAELGLEGSWEPAGAETRAPSVPPWDPIARWVVKGG
jgi:hypothetical protein